MPIQFDLPPISSAYEAGEVAGAVLGAVAAGTLSPAEGAAVMGLVEQYRRTLETSAFEARISALEGKGKI